MDFAAKKNIEWIEGLNVPKNSNPATVAAAALGRLARRDKRALDIAGIRPGDTPRTIGVKARAPGVVARLKTFFASWKRPKAKVRLTGNTASRPASMSTSRSTPGATSTALPMPSLTELQTENSRLRGQLNALASDYKAKAAEFENFRTNPSAQIKTAASRQAVGIVSGSFCAALPADGLESFDKTKSRSDFGKLSPQAKSDFMRGGGKLTD